MRESARRILRARRGRMDRDGERGGAEKLERSPRRLLEFAVAVLIAVLLILLILGLQTRLIG
jgi:uncharacterized membrane protein YphA (DoxX/SURF4 family)